MLLRKSLLSGICKYFANIEIPPLLPIAIEDDSRKFLSRLSGIFNFSNRTFQYQYIHIQSILKCLAYLPNLVLIARLILIIKDRIDKQDLESRKNPVY
jgi:hypothetical protein